MRPKLIWSTWLPVIPLLFVGVTIYFVALKTIPRNLAIHTSLRVANWPWFEDSYFNIRFQYPPEWKVEKLDVTNYYNESRLDLAGEDAAFAGPDAYKTWILKVTPPYDDIQHIDRGQLGDVRSSMTIEQPNPLYANNPEDRRYESVLKPYGENFRFDFTDHFTTGSGIATTSLSFGHSPDGVIAGIAAIRMLPSGYCYRAHMTMTDDLGRNESNIIVFTNVINSMQLLASERSYVESDYKIPVQPIEYKIPALR